MSKKAASLCVPHVRQRASLEWIFDVQEVKFSEVPIGCIQLSHIVLPQEADEMRIGHQLASDRKVTGDFSIDIQKSVSLGQGSNMWNLEESPNIG